MKPALVWIPASTVGLLGAFVAMCVVQMSVMKLAAAGDMRTFVVVLFSAVMYVPFRLLFRYGFNTLFRGRKTFKGLWFDGGIFVGALLAVSRELVMA